MSIETIDVKNKPRTIKKKVYLNNEWVELLYVRVVDDQEQNGKVEKWCIEHYGFSQGHYHQGASWFKVQKFVMMNDKIYVHYTLANE